MTSSKVSIIGDGSWATAIMKMLLQNNIKPGWFVRDSKRREHIIKHHRNPDYLSSVDLDADSISFFHDLPETISQSDKLIFVVPSVYLKETLSCLDKDMHDKIVVSAIKGIIPGDNILIADYFRNYHNVNPDLYAVISGPSHAEVVAMEKLSYLTIAASQLQIARDVAELISSKFIKTSITQDVYGTEYSVALKNIMAIAAGICHGLNYGDNFQAVLVSNAIQEILRFLSKVDPRTRDIKGSSYLGDLLVTAYSQFSRNRTFGTMIAQGYSVHTANMEMNMVVEGYHAVKCIHELKQELLVHMPITDAVYNILYENISPGIEIRLLTEHLS